jgi:hypothetical protein
MPIGIDWPEEIYTTPEGLWSIVIGSQEHPLSEMSIDLVSPAREGPLLLAVSSENKRGEWELSLYEQDEAPNYRFLLQSGEKIQIKRGGGQSLRISVISFTKIRPSFGLRTARHWKAISTSS